MKRCKYFTTWQENQSPIGSGYYWPETFADCTHPKQDEEGFEKYFEKCDETCPLFEELPKCERHPDEYLYPEEGCNACMAEHYGYVP